MKTNKYFTGTIALSVFVMLSSCNKEEAIQKDAVQKDEAVEISSMLAAKSSVKSPAVGYLYTMTNEATQNSILCFGQSANGRLTYESVTLSGGAGSGVGLGSQNSLVIDKNHRWLYAVNAGGNSVSSFSIQNDGSLLLAHTVSTKGVLPISVTVYDNLLYVVNSTSSDICGFTLSSGGEMIPIPGSNKSLSAAAAGPAQISFRPDGEKLIVTEKNTNMITTYSVNAAGKAGSIHSQASAGQTPFGFDFSGYNYMVVTEASGGMPNASTVSSYMTNAATDLIKGPIAANQTSACWAAVSSDGRNAFVTNTSSNTISSFAIGSSGNIALIKAVEVETGATPIDLTFSGNSFYVYNINSGSHSISEYKRSNREALVKIGEMTDLPAHAVGIAAY